MPVIVDLNKSVLTISLVYSFFEVTETLQAALPCTHVRP